MTGAGLDVAEVLAAHGAWESHAGGFHCDCGEVVYDHPAHVAAALAPLMAERERAAAERALLDAASDGARALAFDADAADWLRGRAVLADPESEGA